MVCGAKIRPLPDDTELVCDIEGDEGHEEHHAALQDYAFPGSVTNIVWLDGDRRTFRGAWTSCDDSRCPLPAGHARGHAF